MLKNVEKKKFGRHYSKYSLLFSQESSLNEIFHQFFVTSKCQKVCQSLDVAVNVEIPIEEWYWPPIHDEQTRDDSDDEPKDESDESEYDSDSELSNQENDSDDDQIDKALRRRKKKKESTQKEKEETKEQEENEEKIEVNIEDQVNTLLNHLRTKYFYCVWCGIQYNDETDINNKCPGVDKDDH